MSNIINCNSSDFGDFLEVCNQCLFCGSVDAEIVARSVGDFFFKADVGLFDFMRCLSCSSLWLKTRPCGGRLQAAYEGYYTHATDATLNKSPGIVKRLKAAYVNGRFAAKTRISDRILTNALRFFGVDLTNLEKEYRFAPKAPAKLLDYGCGNGDYLLKMGRLGYALSGSEYDEHLLEKLAKCGLEIVNIASIDDISWKMQFNHITMAHVLEHVHDPLALLNRAFDWLHPGGTLFVEVPNADAIGFAIFGSFWRGLEAPRHFALPSRLALIKAFSDAGFTVDFQHIEKSARRWVWDESLEVVEPEGRASFKAAIASAPIESEANAEFLTFVVRRPA